MSVSLKPKKVFIFVPGYYGSTLVEPKSGRTIWGDPKEVLLGRKSLAMPIPGMKVPGALNLEPHQLINSVSLLGGLLKEEAYEKTIDLLRQLNPEAVLPVAWDWRQDPMHGILRLDETVRQARRRFPQAQLSLVSHSFGSVISSYYLRYGTQDYFAAKETWEGLSHFSHVVLTAAPFRGLMAMFRNMLNGFRFGLNPNLQTPLAFCSFESSYYLLPPAGLDLVQNELGETISLKLHDSNLWQKNRWGLFHEKLKLDESSIDARKKFTSLHLTRAEKFHQLLSEPTTCLPAQHGKALYLQGFGFKTIQKGVWLQEHNDPNVFLYYARDFKKYKPALKTKKSVSLNYESVYADGDQTVPDFSAELLPSLNPITSINLKTKRTHLEVLQHASSQKVISDFLKT